MQIFGGERSVDVCACLVFWWLGGCVGVAWCFCFPSWWLLWLSGVSCSGVYGPERAGDPGADDPGASWGPLWWLSGRAVLLGCGCCVPGGSGARGCWHFVFRWEGCMVHL